MSSTLHTKHFLTHVTDVKVFSATLYGYSILPAKTEYNTCPKNMAKSSCFCFLVSNVGLALIGDTTDLAVLTFRRICQQTHGYFNILYLTHTENGLLMAMSLCIS